MLEPNQRKLDYWAVTCQKGKCITKSEISSMLKDILEQKRCDYIDYFPLLVTANGLFKHPENREVR